MPILGSRFYGKLKTCVPVNGDVSEGSSNSEDEEERCHEVSKSVSKKKAVVEASETVNFDCDSDSSLERWPRSGKHSSLIIPCTDSESSASDVSSSMRDSATKKPSRSLAFRSSRSLFNNVPKTSSEKFKKKISTGVPKQILYKQKPVILSERYPRKKVATSVIPREQCPKQRIFQSVCRQKVKETCPSDRAKKIMASLVTNSDGNNNKVLGNKRGISSSTSQESESFHVERSSSTSQAETITSTSSRSLPGLSIKDNSKEHLDSKPWTWMSNRRLSTKSQIQPPRKQIAFDSHGITGKSHSVSSTLPRSDNLNDPEKRKSSLLMSPSNRSKLSPKTSAKGSSKTEATDDGYGKENHDSKDHDSNSNKSVVPTKAKEIREKRGISSCTSQKSQSSSADRSSCMSSCKANTHSHRNALVELNSRNNLGGRQSSRSNSISYQPMRRVSTRSVVQQPISQKEFDSHGIIRKSHSVPSGTSQNSKNNDPKGMKNSLINSKFPHLSQKAKNVSFSDHQASLNTLAARDSSVSNIPEPEHGKPSPKGDSASKKEVKSKPSSTPRLTTLGEDLLPSPGLSPIPSSKNQDLLSKQVNVASTQNNFPDSINNEKGPDSPLAQMLSDSTLSTSPEKKEKTAVNPSTMFYEDGSDADLFDGLISDDEFIPSSGISDSEVSRTPSPVRLSSSKKTNSSIKKTLGSLKQSVGSEESKSQEPTQKNIDAKESSTLLKAQNRKRCSARIQDLEQTDDDPDSSWRDEEHETISSDKASDSPFSDAPSPIRPLPSTSKINASSANTPSGSNVTCRRKQKSAVNVALKTKRAPKKSNVQKISNKSVSKTSHARESIVQNGEGSDDDMWRDGDLEEVKFSDEPDFSIPEAVKSPIDYFSYFFDSDLIDLIVEETNLYSTQERGKCIAVDGDEIRAFIGILIYMGMCTLPSIIDYWAAHTLVPQVANVMSRTRFQTIRANIHFHDNQVASDDRYLKVRPLFDHLRRKCQELEHEFVLSVDESMVPYKGTRAGGLRQYLPDKPSSKWGFKIFVLAGSSGMIYDFIPYAGESTFDLENVSDEEKKLGVGAVAVISLCKSIPQPESTTVTFDNWYTGLPLITYLRQNMNLHSMGTVKRNRTAHCPLTDAKDFQKNARGTYESKISKDAIVVVQWLDNKPVILASSFAGVAPVQSILRYSKEEKSKVNVPCPLAVTKYNKSMGGVDLADMFMALYRVPTRARKFYFPLVGFSIELALTNAWLMFKRDCKLLGVTDKELPFKTSKEFRLSVSSSLTTPQQRGKGRPSLDKSLSNKKIKRPIVPRPQNELRLDAFNHWPQFGKKGRCRYCKTGYSRIKCSKCDVVLCLVESRNCFVQFHLDGMKKN